MKDHLGATILECIITLSIYTIVISLALSLYLTGYKLYRFGEQQIEIEANVRIALDKITADIRMIDNQKKEVRMIGARLWVGVTQYYLENKILYERTGSGTNQLAQGIAEFKPYIENNTLILVISGESDTKKNTFTMKLVLYLGGA